MRVRARRTGCDEGFTLVEVLVSFFMLTLLLLAVGGMFAKSQTTQSQTERGDKAIALGQVIISKAQQASYSNLGFYAGEAGYSTATTPQTLPLWKTAAGNVVDDPAACGGAVGCSTKVTENKVLLASTRPAGTTAFNTDASLPFANATNKSVQQVVVNGTQYRIDTWVTAVLGDSDGDGVADDMIAKRVTVQGEWPAGAGTCAGERRCVTQSFVRYPLSSEQNPLNAATAPAACSDTTLAVCQTYVQSGRVLVGGSFAGLDMLPRQDEEVLLFARTTTPVTDMRATWLWTNLNGSTTPVEIANFTKVDGDATRWKAVIPSDPADTSSTPTGQFKGHVRPGEIGVTFVATSGATTATATQQAKWSYTSAVPVTVSVGSSVGSCTSNPALTGSAVRINVTGLSIGYGAGVTAQSSADTVQATYTVTEAGQAVTKTVDAVLDPTSVAPQYTESSGRVTGGHVNATFTIQSPPDASCPTVSTNAVITVNRASDGTSTPVSLKVLQAYVPGPLPAPTMNLTLDQSTGKVNADWTGVPQATTHVVEWSINGAAFTSDGGSSSTRTESAATSITPLATISAGDNLRARVAAVNPSAQSPWSNIPTVYRAPGTPTVTAVKSAPGKVTFSWPAVSGATSYIVRWVAGDDGTKAVNTTQSGTSFTMSAANGQNANVSVYAQNAGGVSVPGGAGFAMPLFEDLTLYNGWVNYQPIGGDYATARYTKTTAGAVLVSGLVKNGSVTAGTVIGVLPEGYRPAQRLMFTTAAASAGTRLSVDTSGNIMIGGTQTLAAAATWTSLTTISFMPADPRYTVAGMGISSPFTNHAGEYGTPGAVLDSEGRVWMHGLVDHNSTPVDNAVIAPLSAVYGSDYYLHLASTSGDLPSGVGVSVNSVVAKGNAGPYWTSLMHMYQSSGNASKWQALTLQNGWVQYGGAYAPAQIVKNGDGIVSLRGLLKAGTVTNGTVVATLPVGYRPTAVLIFDVQANQQFARVDVFPGGQVIFREGVSAAWTALDSIHFRAEQ